MKKKLLAYMMVACMLVGTMPATAWADETAPESTPAVTSDEAPAAEESAADADTSDEISTQKELNDAIAKASGETTIELVASEPAYTLPTIKDKVITFKGTKDVVIDMTEAVNASGSTITFDGVTVEFDNDNYEGLQHSTKVVYTDCTIYGTQFLYAPTVEFEDCTFKRYDASTEYNVWTYGAKNVTFTDCTFDTGGKAILVYTEATHEATIKLTDCNFDSDGTIATNKAAVEVGQSAYGNKAKYEVVIDNCTAEGFVENNSTSPLVGNKNSMDAAALGVVIDGVAYVKVNNQAELEAAIEAADKDVPMTIVLADSETAYTLSAINGKEITFEGTENAVINVPQAVAMHGSTITFEGVTVQFPADANYVGFQHTEKVVYNDCTIKGQQTMYAPKVAFNNCTFENKDAYCVWTYGATDATFTDCTFNTGGKAILVYNEVTDGNFVADIALNSCTFNDDNTLTEADGTNLKKAAVETGTNANNTETNNKYNIIFNACEVNGFYANNSASPLLGNKNNMDSAHLTGVDDGIDITNVDKAKIDTAAKDAKETIDDLEYLNSKDKEECKEAIDAIVDEAKAKIDAGESAADVIAKAEEAIDKIVDDAKEADKAQKPSSSKPSSGSKRKSYAISEPDVENGSISVNSSAKSGSTVKITVKPDKGYELDELKVTDKDGKEIKLKDNGDGTFSFTMPKSKVEIDAEFEKVEDAFAEEPAVDETDKALILTIGSKIISVDGEYIVYDVAPVIKGERTMLPIRVVAEYLGADVEWDDAADKVTITKGELVIEIFINQPFATVNGTPVQLDAPAFIENGRTYLPLRFVAENLGAAVTWDGNTNTVTIVPAK